MRDMKMRHETAGVEYANVAASFLYFRLHILRCSHFPPLHFCAAFSCSAFSVAHPPSELKRPTFGVQAPVKSDSLTHEYVIIHSRPVLSSAQYNDHIVNVTALMHLKFFHYYFSKIALATFTGVFKSPYYDLTARQKCI